MDLGSNATKLVDHVATEEARATKHSGNNT